MGTFSCGTWDLVPRPGIEPGTLALGAWRLSPWTTRDVPTPYVPDLEPKCLTRDTCCTSILKTGGRGSELLSRPSKLTTSKRPLESPGCTQASEWVLCAGPEPWRGFLGVFQHQCRGPMDPQNLPHSASPGLGYGLGAGAFKSSPGDSNVPLGLRTSALMYDWLIGRLLPFNQWTVPAGAGYYTWCRILLQRPHSLLSPSSPSLQNLHFYLD